MNDFLNHRNLKYLVWTLSFMVISPLFSSVLDFHSEKRTLKAKQELAEQNFKIRLADQERSLKHLLDQEKVVDAEVNRIRSNAEYFKSIGDTVAYRNEINRSNAVLLEYEERIETSYKQLSDLQSSDIMFTMAREEYDSHMAKSIWYVWIAPTLGFLASFIWLYLTIKVGKRIERAAEHAH